MCVMDSPAVRVHVTERTTGQPLIAPLGPKIQRRHYASAARCAGVESNVNVTNVCKIGLIHSSTKVLRGVLRPV